MAESMWGLVDWAAATQVSVEGRIEALAKRAAELPPAQLVAFQRELLEWAGRLAEPKVLAAATVLTGEAMNETDAAWWAGWIISQGREATERVLADPDQLAEVYRLGEDDYYDGDDMFDVFDDAHLAQTGESIFDRHPELDLEENPLWVSGDPVLDDLDRLDAEYPRCLRARENQPRKSLLGRLFGR